MIRNKCAKIRWYLSFLWYIVDHYSKKENNSNYHLVYTKWLFCDSNGYMYSFFSDDYFNYLIDIMWWLIILTLVFHRKQCHSNLFFKSEIVSVAKNAHTMWCLNLNDRPKDFQQGVKGSVCTFPINPIPRVFVVVVCLLHKSPVKKKVITIQFFYIVDKNRALL